MWKKASMSKFTCISNYDPRGSGNDVNENFCKQIGGTIGVKSLFEPYRALK